MEFLRLASRLGFPNGWCELRRPQTRTAGSRAFGFWIWDSEAGLPPHQNRKSKIQNRSPKESVAPGHPPPSSSEAGDEAIRADAGLFTLCLPDVSRRAKTQQGTAKTVPCDGDWSFAQTEAPDDLLVSGSVFARQVFQQLIS